ncbi:MAG: hypothetical protein JJU45_15015 [Acidimicrobiia bacterium]|nr:hypothetical protein [Acidimicrobiia bacterium]
MAVQVVVRDLAVDVEISGVLDVAACLSTGMRIPLDDVEWARPISWDEARTELGWRLFGAYVPGQLATGWYTTPGRKGARQFWAVFRDRSSLLEIRTRLERPSRLVLAHEDRDRLAWWINERVHPADGFERRADG